MSAVAKNNTKQTDGRMGKNQNTFMRPSFRRKDFGLSFHLHYIWAN